MTRSPARTLALLVAAVTVVAACGGDDSATTTPPPPVTDGAAATEATDAPETTNAPETTGVPETTDSLDPEYTPGDVAFRIVNLLDEPVDVYVRTTGLVTAYAMEAGVAPGAVTERYSPPSQGKLVITTAGAGDPECVMRCDHFIAEASTFPEEGNLRTIVLYDNDGTRGAFDVWEDPTADRTTSANAMVAADPTTGLFVVLAVALQDAQFGQQLSFQDVDGCQENITLSNILVGGNQTPAFAYDGNSVDVLLHDNQDRECVEEPTGGPFTIVGGPGTRNLLVLSGSPGDMDALVLPIGSDEMAPTPPTGGGDDAEAIQLLSADLMAETGLPAADALCVAGDLVEILGADYFVDANGELIDAEMVSDAEFERFLDVVFPILDGCGVDRSALGG